MSSGHLFNELLTRLTLSVLFLILQGLSPRMREIHDEEWWLYKNLRSASYVPAYMVYILLIVIGAVFWFVLVILVKRQNIITGVFLGYSLSILVNGCITDMIKLLVGRPRPDFFYRCFPDGVSHDDCTGPQTDIIEGRKSFPSGHSSFAWSSLTFAALLIAGQLQLFSLHHPSSHKLQDTGICEDKLLLQQMLYSTIQLPRKAAWKLCLFLSPICLAAVISLSRMIDYHHHPEDVAVGSLLGFLVGYTCYRLYFPPISHPVAHQLLDELHSFASLKSRSGSPPPPSLHPTTLSSGGGMQDPGNAFYA